MTVISAKKNLCFEFGQKSTSNCSGLVCSGHHHDDRPSFLKIQFNTNFNLKKLFFFQVFRLYLAAVRLRLNKENERSTHNEAWVQRNLE